ncbi:MAG: NAD(P)-dependent methylenetetrahydromethanopterin dehydrogenase [Methylophilaceae bacterium]
MKKAAILHLITSAKNVSPFDVNMAIDAGFEYIVPYINVQRDEVVALTQDAIFSRSPDGIKREAIFLGGRDIHLALEMQTLAKEAMFEPFAFSSFADPSGAFTTAAAMLAKVNQHQALKNQTLAIFGATGPVGLTSALIAEAQGANVQLVAHRDMASVQVHADTLQLRYGCKVQVVDGSSDSAKIEVLQSATLAICAAAAGIRVLDFQHFAQSKTLKVMADVNAVAPSGVAGVDAKSNGENIGDTQIKGIGALAIGQLKYTTQHKLLQQLLSVSKPAHLACNDAYQFACENVSV